MLGIGGVFASGELVGAAAVQNGTPGKIADRVEFCFGKGKSVPGPGTAAPELYR